jgi:penicillin-binding protein 1A
MKIHKERLVAALKWLRNASKQLYNRIKAQFVKAKTYPLYKRIAFYVGVFFSCLFLFLFLIDINIFWLFGRSPRIADLMDPSMNVASELYSDDGRLIGKYFVENRTPVAYKDLTKELVNALVATEDVRFYDHWGIDFRGTASALYSTAKGDRRGGSTITQQLVKNLFKTRDDYSKGLFGFVPGVNVMIYKLKEWITSVKIELFYSKQEILTMYFNTVSFGSNSHGIKTAAATFFSKKPIMLKTEEAALLVGLLKAPSYYSPVRRPKNAFERRNVVLDQMAKYGFISNATADSLKRLPLKLAYNPDENIDGNASYIRDAVSSYLKPWLKENEIDLYEDGLKIYTTINLELQQYAEDAVAEQMKMLQRRFVWHWEGRNPWADAKGVEIPNFIEDAAKQTRRYAALKEKFGAREDSISYYLNLPRKMKVFTWDGVKDTTFSPMDSLRYYKKFLHAGFVSMDPNSGYIKTWVGGINYPFFKYDHVKQSKRQPGSLFKAYVYAAAMDEGFGPCDKLVDSPIVVNYVEKGQQKSWSPKNADGHFSGAQVTLKHAFAKSINSIAVQLTQRVGWNKVIEYAHKMGITVPLASVPSVSLGSSDVSLYEMVNSYAPMVNGGFSVKPILVTKIVNKRGKVIYEAEPQKKRVLNEMTAFYMLELLKSGLTEPGATTQALFEYDLFKQNTDFGGKTGTSSNQSDGWFIGVSPNLISGSWVGAESRAVHFRTTELGEGCKTALPIYGKFMQKVINDNRFAQLRGHFTKPSSKIPKEYTCHTRYVPKHDPLDSLLDNSVDLDIEESMPVE